MRKLQLFIIIFSALLVSYNCVPDFMIKADVNSFYVDVDGSRESVLTISKQDTPNKSFMSSAHFDPLYFSGNDKVTEFQLEADIPEKSDVSNYEIMLTWSAFESTPIVAAYNPAMGLFHFPSEAYRLRI